MNESPGIRAVVFDAYGTLVEIANPKRVYRRLLDRLAANGRPVTPDDAARVMTVDASLADLVEWLGGRIEASDLAELQRDLAAELASVRAFDDTLPALAALRGDGLRIGLCSNLATPFAEPIRHRLPELDAYAWSFEVGAIKPDPRIYRHICQALDVEPGQVMMVGDTHSADVDGPRQFGMQALHLVRDPARSSPESQPLRSLAELVARCNQH